MYVYIPDPRDLLSACAIAIAAILITSTVVDASMIEVRPDSTMYSDVGAEMWVVIDGGSLATMHGSHPTNGIVPISYSPTDGPTGDGVEWSYSLAGIVDGWLDSVIDADAVGVPSAG